MMSWAIMPLGCAPATSHEFDLAVDRVRTAAEKGSESWSEVNTLCAFFAPGGAIATGGHRGQYYEDVLGEMGDAIIKTGSTK